MGRGGLQRGQDRTTQAQRLRQRLDLRGGLPAAQEGQWLVGCSSTRSFQICVLNLEPIPLDFQILENGSSLSFENEKKASHV